MSKVYVVMVADRHLDAEPYLYADLGRATARARDEAAALGCTERSTVNTPQWLFVAIHPTESDAVWIIEREISA